MDQNGIFMADLVLELSYGFQEGLALNIANGAADLDDGDAHVGIGEIPVKTALDLIGNVRNDLNRAASVVAAALFLQNRPVDFSGGHVGVLVQTLVDEAFIMTEIQIRFRAVVCDKNLPVLDRVHGAWIDVDIRIELLHGYFVAPGFEQPSE